MRGGFMRVELARSVDEFTRVVTTQDDRDEVRGKLLIDFAFIGAYWAVFAASSALLGLRGFSQAPWLAALAGELGTLAALLDVTENVNTLQLLRAIEGGSGRAAVIVKRMRSASLRKWLFASAATGLLSVTFFQRGAWFYVLGGVYVTVAAVGVVTIAAEALAARTSRSPRAIDLMLAFSFLGMGAALLVGLPFAAAIA